jgi:PilZ domain
MGSLPPLVEVYLVVEQPRQRLGHWLSVLAPLDTMSAPPLASVSAHYDPTRDQALICLRYDSYALGAGRMSFVIEVAVLGEIVMLQPSEMAEGDRRRFTSDRLGRCTLQIVDQDDVGAALSELVKLVRETRAAARQAQPPPLPIRPRGSGVAPMPTGVKGTRDDLPKLAKSTRDMQDTAPPRGPHIIPRKQLGMEEPMGELDDDLGLEASAPEVRPPSVIYARYLRSGRWVPIRIGALSLKGASLMSGVLPRMHDHVDLALAFGSYRALVRGEVARVSTPEEASASGASSFSVNFVLDDASRKQLTALLTAARAANVTIKPPPARATRRFPVEWPISIGTPRGVVKADALDISSEGMFVRPLHALELESTLNFSAILDDTNSPAVGRALVVRQITEAEARTAGLSTGYGLRIADMGDADRQRWLAFVHRVERRADKRVLIGASPARLAELQSSLAAAGYAVMGGTDPGALVQLASADARPVDAALIDANWLQPGAGASWVESLFSARNVPCLTMHGDSRRARNAIDKLLAVV